MSKEAHEPHSVFLAVSWAFYLCKVCGKRFLLGITEGIPRPRACPYCGVSYTQFKNEAGEFEPL